MIASPERKEQTSKNGISMSTQELLKDKKLSRYMLRNKLLRMQFQKDNSDAQKSLTKQSSHAKLTSTISPAQQSLSQSILDGTEA